MTDSRIIIPLDGMNVEDALSLADELEGQVWGFKANDLADSVGVDIVSELRPFGRVMADLKLADIPNTNRNRAAKWAEADLLTIHASNTLKAIKAAVNGAGDVPVLGVTVLTSYTEADCLDTFGCSISEAVIRFAKRAKFGGCAGIVCSPLELKVLAKVEELEGMMRVTPAIRPHWHQKDDDQKRKATPGQAIKDGASFLVIGRPITDADDPVEAAKLTNEEVNKALEELKED